MAYSKIFCSFLKERGSDAPFFFTRFIYFAAKQKRSDKISRYQICVLALASGNHL